MWRDVPHPANPQSLLFRYDPERDIIQIADRGVKYTVDLAELRKVVEQRVCQVLAVPAGKLK